jgi:hypothetical protein
MNVECPRVSFVYKYENGIMIVATGHLMVQFVMSSEGVWKIEHMDFSSQGFEEYINRASIRSEPITNSKKKASLQHSVFPDSPINKWGLPSRVYHILQMSDVAERFGEVVFHSIVTGLGPQESLGAIAFHKQQELSKDTEGEDSKSQMMDAVYNMAPYNMAPSPIVKTQTGVRPQQQSFIQQQQQQQQQQAALRQQQMQAAVLHQQFQQPPTPHYQSAYPTNTSNNNNSNQFTSTPTTSPMTRKRNSIASDVKSPVARKRTNTGNNTRK